MTTLTKIDPRTVADGLNTGRFHLVDIREADEFAHEHIEGAVSVPLSALDAGGLMLEGNRQTVFHCRSGMRTEANCARLAAHVDGEAYVLDGGLEAWKSAGLPLAADARAPLPIMRQVQITAGGLVLLGVMLSLFVHPAWIGLSGFTGAGLMFAGLSGWCGMAHLLAFMPWNRNTKAIWS